MQNEALFREVNERVEELGVGLAGAAASDGFVSGFVCECGSDSCVELVQVAHSQYEVVRDNPCRFIVLPGHQDPELERVVERNGRYWVVEKTGEASDLAAERDPRS